MYKLSDREQTFVWCKYLDIKICRQKRQAKRNTMVDAQSPWSNYFFKSFSAHNDYARTMEDVCNLLRSSEISIVTKFNIWLSATWSWPVGFRAHLGLSRLASLSIAQGNNTRIGIQGWCIGNCCLIGRKRLDCTFD